MSLNIKGSSLHLKVLGATISEVSNLARLLKKFKSTSLKTSYGL